ncbi:MAG: 3-methyl-2-oxobutanoate hydroxymethyltransferase [Deltaproteobacteria bacterium]|nr:3-methyl-2-oxobutanoate hydroxymethyltransferase [Deltaproteobacteria bacterium]MBI3387031.1 3-methyl-2-oxobutanoate hydroxymethyltransferase [Deltaproteobacteria bacterium]
MERKVTVPDLLKRKGVGEPIVAITAYDFPFTRIVDSAGIDLILVGDSLGMVVQGLDTTLPVSMDEMIYHCRMVTRARPRALVVGDLPFLSYQVTVHDAVANAGRLIKDGNVEAVKLEGGVAVAETIRAIASVDIPIMGHIGLTPQSVHRMGGHKVQGRQRGSKVGQRERVIDDALAVEDAGAFAVVLEGIPRDLATEITERLSIPTVGIGAGPDCDGQILVLHDVLGLSESMSPRFAKRYAEVWHVASEAVRAYVEDVRSGVFPTDQHAFHSLTPVPGKVAAQG